MKPHYRSSQLDKNNKLLLAETLIEFTKKDLFGRPKFRLFRNLKVLPSANHIREYVLDGKREGVNAEQVKAALEVLCGIAAVGCPLLDE